MVDLGGRYVPGDVPVVGRFLRVCPTGSHLVHLVPSIAFRVEEAIARCGVRQILLRFLLGGAREALVANVCHVVG